MVLEHHDLPELVGRVRGSGAYRFPGRLRLHGNGGGCIGSGGFSRIGGSVCLLAAGDDREGQESSSKGPKCSHLEVYLRLSDRGRKPVPQRAAGQDGRGKSCASSAGQLWVE